MLLQKAQRSSPFWNKICICCAFYWPKANLFCSNWSNSYVWRDSRIFLSNHKLVFSLLAAAWFVTSQVWTLVVKRTTSLFNSFFSNVAKQVASFCCPVCRTFRRFVYRESESYELSAKNVRNRHIIRSTILREFLCFVIFVSGSTRISFNGNKFYILQSGCVLSRLSHL